MEEARLSRIPWWLPLALAACQSDGPPAPETTAGLVEARAWEHERSDIPVDPRIRFGRLDNGLRWAWARGTEPKERSYLRLHVDVGSLAEEEDELGMAHFLEHMAFNGSEHFEAGTLIEWFQSHGMSFGADTNAHTGFGETVYKLDLPQSDAETLREGLLVLRDFADGLLLSAEEVEAEKGVIDGEERESDSAARRVSIQALERLYGGTRFPERLPIGTEDVRHAFTGASVRSFYERWYRPQNMTLALVGDLGDLDPGALFEEAFGDMDAGTAPLAREPETGRVRGYDTVFTIHDEEIPVARLTVQRLEPWEHEPNTIAEWVEEVPIDYARAMVDLRLRELAKAEGAPYLGAGLASAEAFDAVDGEALHVSAPPETWPEALVFCTTELRRALEFGFQQAELDEVRARALRGMDEAVDREATQHSGALLSGILAAAEEEYVPTSARDRRAILRPAIEALTVEQCHAALVRAWSEGELSLSATGSLGGQEGAEERLRAAYRAAAEAPLEAGETIEVQAFAYASDPERRGEIVGTETVADLGFEEVRFANGVRVNVKRTDFKEKQVLISARVGEGRLTLAPEDSVVEWVGSRVFDGIGLEAHSVDDLRRLTAGRTVGVDFSAGIDAFELGGSTTAEDLLLQCELMCAYLSAPGWREEGWVELQRVVPLMYDGLKHQHQGPLVQSFLPALFSGDPRFGFPAQQDVEACGLEAVRGWLAPHLAEAPIEVSLVGDLDVEQTIAIAARTFGTLPARRAPRRYEEHRSAPAPLAGLRQEHTIDTEVPKALVMIVFPTTDGIDVERERKLSVLGTIVNDRLRLEVRERLGASYSPGSGVETSRVFPGVGMLMIQAMSDPDKVETLVEACLDVADSLATAGVTDEEAERLRTPVLKKRRDAKRTNGYWLGVLSRAQGEVGHLDEVRSADGFYASYTAADIAPLARRFLGRGRASILVVRPTAPGAADEGGASRDG